LARHLGRRLWVTTQPNLAGLPPRQRQVLDGLLEGDLEKQVAAKLELAPATVHIYVTRIYRHFGVNSRAELLAYFLRRYRRPSKLRIPHP
jgi:DNA-binding NarL/FixJ family response regulator